jgi:CBS domain-containing protein
MTLHDILKSKGTAVHLIGPQATLQDAVGELVRHRIGSLLVCDRDPESGEQVRGIVTERDVLYACDAGKPLSEVKVADVMSRNLITGSPADSVEDAMGLMTQHRIRHLPVLAKGRLVGMVSIGDVVKAQHHQLAMENHFMRDYIRG